MKKEVSWRAYRNNLTKLPTHIRWGGHSYWGNCYGHLGILGALSFVPWLLSIEQFYTSYFLCMTGLFFCFCFSFFNMVENTAPNNS